MEEKNRLSTELPDSPISHLKSLLWKNGSFVLSQQPEEEAQNLALDMELYVEGSLDIFSHKTNIQTGSNFLIYNVKKLGDELKQIALMVVFDQIWNRVVRNQKLGKKTWIYFDEMQLLLLDNMPVISSLNCGVVSENMEPVRLE